MLLRPRRDGTTRKASHMSLHISVPHPISALSVDPAARLHAARIHFRTWRRTRPFWAGVWTLLGGAFIAYVPSTAFRFVMFTGTMVWAGIVVGLVIALLGLLLWVQPHLRALLAVMIQVLALVSFFTSDFGGFLIGMITAMIGGSMALAWTITTPEMETAAGEPEAPDYDVAFPLTLARPASVDDGAVLPEELGGVASMGAAPAITDPPGWWSLIE